MGDVFQIRKTRKGTYDAGKGRFQEALVDLEDENVGHLLNDIVASTSVRTRAADVPTAHTLWYGADAQPPDSEPDAEVEYESESEVQDSGGGNVNLWHGSPSSTKEKTKTTKEKTKSKSKPKTRTKTTR